MNVDCISLLTEILQDFMVKKSKGVINGKFLVMLTHRELDLYG